MAASNAAGLTEPLAPPLKAGEKLSRDEFERRYNATPNLKKAELIEGVVHMPSPVRWKHHGNPQTNLITWLGVYKAHTTGVETGDNATIRMDPGNEPQPDAAMIIEPAYGGQIIMSEDDYLEGAPELLAEIAASSADIDLNRKLRVYERNRVQEYLVWRVLDEAVDWFILKQSRFERLPLGADGIYRSVVFPGLWLAVAALVHSDLAKVLQVLQQGLASAEHAAFVLKLQAEAGLRAKESE
jgi:Uma2 family endonuclease